MTHADLACVNTENTVHTSRGTYVTSEVELAQWDLGILHGLVDAVHHTGNDYVSKLVLTEFEHG